MIGVYAPAAPPSEGDGALVLFLFVLFLAVILSAVEWHDRRTGNYPRDWEE